MTTRQINCALELGCGISTVLIALGIGKANREATLISLESDEHWLNRTVHVLEILNLAERVQVYHAPLSDQVIDGRNVRVHRFDRFAGKRPDFFFIDAPTKDVGREGTLPYFHQFIEPGAIIVLDDVERQGENDAISSWCASGLVSLCGYLSLGHGIAVMTAKKA